MPLIRYLAGAACASAFLACTAAAAQTAPHPFTARAMANLERVSDPHLSADGKWVVYDQRSTDYEANKSHHAIWLAPSDGASAPTRLKASDGGASHPRWSADGRWIYFLSARSGSMQVWRTDPKSQAVEPATHISRDVDDFRLSPDGKTIAVALAVFPDCKDLACTTARLAARQDQKATGRVYDKLLVRHWLELGAAGGELTSSSQGLSV